VPPISLDVGKGDKSRLSTDFDGLRDLINL